MTPPDFENPTDSNFDNIYDINLKVENLNQEKILPVQVVVLNENEIPLFTNVGQGFDVSTATFAINTLSVSSEEFFPRGIAFNSSGTKMFIVGNEGNAVVEYDMESFDLSTGAYSGASEEFSIASQEVSVKDIAFNNDGTKMFIIGASGDAVVEYSLVTPYDVSTAIYSGASEEFIVSARENNPGGFAFSNDGTKMFVVGLEIASIIEYHLSTAFDVSTAAYISEFSIASEETLPTGIQFNSDGTKVFIIGLSGDAVVEYSLSSPYDFSGATYAGTIEEFSVSFYETGPTSLVFNPSGTRMYVTGFSNKNVLEYSLASSISYDENSSASIIDIDANDGSGGATDTSVSYSLGGVDASHFSIDASGVITFVMTPDYENPIDADFNNVFEFHVVADNSQSTSTQRIQVRIVDQDDTPVFTNVGTGFDVSTAIYLGESETLNVQAEEDTPTDLTFNNDGTRLYVTGKSDDAVVEYTLSKGYDVSSAIYSGTSEEYILSQESSPTGMVFSNDGSKMFVIGEWVGGVTEYSLTTPFDVSTASWNFPQFTTLGEFLPTDLIFNPDGTKLFVIGGNRIRVIPYTLTTAFDISSATYGLPADEFDLSSEETNPTGLAFNNSGTKMFIVGSTGDAVVEYNLSTAYDVSTAVYAGAAEEFSVIGEESNPTDLIFNDDGTQMFIIGTTFDKIFAYSLASIVEYLENGVIDVIDIDSNDGLGGTNDSSVTYSLGGADASQFSINPSGIVTFNSPPDFETPLDSDSDNIYELVVIAQNIFHQSTQRILVHVEDVSETPIAQFEREYDVEENIAESVYSFETKENRIYSLGSNNDESFFELIGNEINFVAAPDYENPLDSNGDNKYIVDFISQKIVGDPSIVRLVFNVIDVDEFVLNSNDIEGDILIYPNPTDHSFSLINSTFEGDKVLIKDLKGIVVKEYSFSKEEQYNISDIKTGVYLIFLKSGNTLLSIGKLVKVDN